MKLMLLGEGLVRELNSIKCQRVYEVQACDGPRIEMGTHLKKLSLRTKKGIYHEVALYHVKRREQTFLEESMHYIHKYK